MCDSLVFKSPLFLFFFFCFSPSVPRLAFIPWRATLNNNNKILYYAQRGHAQHLQTNSYRAVLTTRYVSVRCLLAANSLKKFSFFLKRFRRLATNVNAYFQNAFFTLFAKPTCGGDRFQRPVSLRVPVTDTLRPRVLAAGYRIQVKRTRSVIKTRVTVRFCDNRIRQ